MTFCGHANENPRVCPCPSTCACRKTMCATSITRPQGAPVKDTGAPSAHDLVIQDMEDRKAFGLQKYGTLLQHDNGRDHLVDAYQEVLDLAVYLRNEIERRKLIADWIGKDLAPYVTRYPCTACRGTGHRLDADQNVAGLGPCHECGGLGVRP